MKGSSEELLLVCELGGGEEKQIQLWTNSQRLGRSGTHGEGGAAASRAGVNPPGGSRSSHGTLLRVMYRSVITADLNRVRISEAAAGCSIDAAV